MAKHFSQLLFSDPRGKIFNFPGLEPAAMKAGEFFRISKDDLIKLPRGSQFFMLPDRVPVGFNPETNKYTALKNNLLSKNNEDCFAVAAFLPPGFTLTYNCAYQELGQPKMLPLFAYGAVCLIDDEFYVAATRVDREKRQEFACVKSYEIKEKVFNLKKLFSGNRLLRHIEDCALVYNCPAAKNFFLSRYEAPLPSSPFCNARCVGCISYQPGKKYPVTQPRIKFVPSPQEIAEIALYHIRNARDPVVSFGQGCEGEPLLAADTLGLAVKMIRKNTSKGIINLNTNASKPKEVAKLFDAGLSSIRVSLNSVREAYYSRYYQPKGYSFSDCLESIKIAGKRGFVSINYLTIPGFTDSQDEFNAFRKFLRAYSINMIQWRNLNFDPVEYFRSLQIKINPSQMLGIKVIINSLKAEFPELMMGYFNPSRERVKRHQRKGAGFV